MPPYKKKQNKIEHYIIFQTFSNAFDNGNCSLYRHCTFITFLVPVFLVCRWNIPIKTVSNSEQTPYQKLMNISLFTAGSYFTSLIFNQLTFIYFLLSFEGVLSFIRARLSTSKICFKVDKIFSFHRNNIKWIGFCVCPFSKKIKCIWMFFSFAAIFNIWITKWFLFCPVQLPAKR